MSSYERLVIHELFAEDPDIKTAPKAKENFATLYSNIKYNAGR